jgi:hypothetical protein
MNKAGTPRSGKGGGLHCGIRDFFTVMGLYLERCVGMVEKQ